MSTNGQHLPSEVPAKPKFFSTIECACGCTNLLPQARVDMGYTFIWGHKKGKASANAPSSGKALRKPIERHAVAPVKTISVSATIELLEAEAKLLHEQMEAKRGFVEAYEKQIADMTIRHAATCAAVIALRQLVKV